MTERDAIKSVVEKSITRTEELRTWAMAKREEAEDVCKNLPNEWGRLEYGGRFDAFNEMIQKIDELEANG